MNTTNDIDAEDLDHGTYCPAIERARAVLARVERTLAQPRDPEMVAAAAAAERRARERQEELDREARQILERRERDETRTVSRAVPAPAPASAPLYVTRKKLNAILDAHVEGMGNAMGRIAEDLRVEFKEELEQAMSTNGALLARVAHLEAMLAGRVLQPIIEGSRHVPLQ